MLMVLMCQTRAYVSFFISRDLSVLHADVQMCQECSSTSRHKAMRAHYTECRLFALEGWWRWSPTVTVILCVATFVYRSSTVFPAVRSWQAFQVGRIQQCPMIHVANSGSPPHLFTTWTQSPCSILNITWRVYVCVRACVFPTVLAAWFPYE